MDTPRNRLNSSPFDFSLTEDEILESLKADRFPHDFVTPPESEYLTTGTNESWKFKTKSRITKKGKEIVRVDPNIEKETLEKLMVTEEKYLKTAKGSKLSSRSKQEIYNEEFLAYHELGLTHLAQCIRENPEQCKADLISAYSEDRSIPFIIGAIYLDALLANDKLYSYELRSKQGYVRVQWEPVVFYTELKRTKPPKKKKHTLRYYDPPLKKYALPDCPVCGSPARMCRAGQQNRLWQVCCTDPEGKCENYLRECQFDKEYVAMKEWVRHVSERSWSMRATES